VSAGAHVLFRTLPLLAALLALFAAPGAAAAMRVAVLPFGCFSVSEGESGRVDVTGVVVRALEDRGVTVLPGAEVSRYLARQRIRRPEFLDRAAIRALGLALDADALLMGFADVQQAGGEPRVALSLQLVDCRDASVAWADSLARTGQDFASVLGLGRIQSLEVLVGRVVTEIMQDLPSELPRSESGPPPFELMRAGFSPDVLRSGEQTTLTLEFRLFQGGIRQVKAYLLGQEVPLRTRDGSTYHGSLQAPAMERVYPLVLYVTDSRNRVHVLEGAASLIVHNSPPQVSVRCNPEVISPNGDGVQDHALLLPEVSRVLTLRGWQATILDAKGVAVRREDGLGPLPQALVWRGTDDQGRTVADGRYRFLLAVEDEAGNRSRAPAVELLMDVTPPGVSVALGPGRGDADVLRLSVQERSGLEFWEVVVRAPGGAEVVRLRGQGPMPETVALPKKKAVRHWGRARLRGAARCGPGIWPATG
jgi:hypothetical protein